MRFKDIEVGSTLNMGGNVVRKIDEIPNPSGPEYGPANVLVIENLYVTKTYIPRAVGTAYRIDPETLLIGG